MLAKTALKNMLAAFQRDLSAQGFTPVQMIVYRSSAHGNPHRCSDVDVALWSTAFDGVFNNFKKVKPVLKNYPLIQAKLYPSFADEANFDPFIEEIKRTGIVIL